MKKNSIVVVTFSMLVMLFIAGCHGPLLSDRSQHHHLNKVAVDSPDPEIAILQKEKNNSTQTHALPIASNDKELINKVSLNELSNNNVNEVANIIFSKTSAINDFTALTLPSIKSKAKMLSKIGLNSDSSYVDPMSLLIYVLIIVLILALLSFLIPGIFDLLIWIFVLVLLIWLIIFLVGQV